MSSKHRTRNCERNGTRSHKAHFSAPILGVFEKLNNLLAGVFREVAFAETRVEHIVPISKHVQIDIVLSKINFAFMLVQPIRSVIEYAETVRHLRSRTPDADIEAQLAQAIRDQIFDQHDAHARFQNPFNLLGTTITFGLFADIYHRFSDQVRNERRVGNTCRLSSGNNVDVTQSDVGLRLLTELSHNIITLVGKRKDFTAIDVDW